MPIRILRWLRVFALLVGLAGAHVQADLNSAVTRQFNYSYNTSGADTGLLQTVSDPRGVTFTKTYDDWLRPATINASGSSVPQQNQNTTYGYDIRGMANSIAQSYAVNTTGPPTLVARSFDAYGQMNQETVSVNGTAASQWNQSWDNTGRRSALNFELAAQGVGAGSQYGYTYNATGLLTQVTNTGSNYGFSYGDNNLLGQRTSPWRTQSITQRDAQGRVTAENVTGGGATLLSEAMGWRPDSRMGSYGVSGQLAPSESRAYSYDTRGRVITEPFLLTTGVLAGSQSAAYSFDQPVQPDALNA